MKACLVCGAQFGAVFPTCPCCGEASWCDPAPLSLADIVEIDGRMCEADLLKTCGGDVAAAFALAEVEDLAEELAEVLIASDVPSDEPSPETQIVAPAASTRPEAPAARRRRRR